MTEDIKKPDQRLNPSTAPTALQDREARALYRALQKSPSLPEAIDRMEAFCRAHIEAEYVCVFEELGFENERSVAAHFSCRIDEIPSMSPNIARKWRDAALDEIRLYVSFGEYAKAICILGFMRKMTTYAEIDDFADDFGAL